MPQLEMTRGDIINAGLALAGRVDLISEARLWLNLFLEQQYMNQDFIWLVKSVTGLEATSGLDFPDDYRAGKSAVLISSTGSKVPIKVIDRADEYDAARMGYNPLVAGRPQVVYASHDDKKFYFSPEPDQAYTWDLKYFHVPELPCHTDELGDEDYVIWGLPTQILIDHVKMRAYEYNDDQRYAPTKTEIQSDIAAAKVNNHDRRAGSSRMPFGKSFRKRF